ncbi:MAG: hypothetical protein AABZ19_01490 [Pseudomonadota bacterium]
MHFLAPLRLAILGLTLAVSTHGECQTHETTGKASGKSSNHGAAQLAALQLRADPAPLSARYAVTITPAVKAKATPVRQQDWYFSRSAEQVALLKGNIDEAWHRDQGGNLRFERIFHEDQRTVDYSAGELKTLNVRADWTALSSFLDPLELMSLAVKSRSGRGPAEQLHLVGRSAGEVVSVDWLPALQLPSRVVRTSRAHGITRIELKEHATNAPSNWPKPGVRSADYLHMDASDFGDMDYETVVKKSEALDIRLGWRTAHGHD